MTIRGLYDHRGQGLPLAKMVDGVITQERLDPAIEKRMTALVNAAKGNPAKLLEPADKYFADGNLDMAIICRKLAGG